jgi:hypothetical protein
MAAGDVVSGLSAINTALTFTPAAGVEVVLTSLANDDQYIRYEITDGTLYSYLIPDNTFYNITNCKVFITNSIYLHINAIGVGMSSGFTGVQTK